MIHYIAINQASTYSTNASQISVYALFIRLHSCCSYRDGDRDLGRQLQNDDGDTAAIVADGKVIALNSCLEDDGLRADVLAMALEVAIVMNNRPGAVRPGRLSHHLKPVPAPHTGLGKFAALMARACGRDTDSAAFEYFVHSGDRR